MFKLLFLLLILAGNSAFAANESEFLAALNEAASRLSPWVSKQYNRTFTVLPNWAKEYPGIGGSVGHSNEFIKINVEGWISRPPYGLEKDALQLVVCHELGHFVFTGAAEDEADYFAANDCLPKVWTKNPELSPVDLREKQCLNSRVDKNFCIRVLRAVTYVHEFRTALWKKSGLTNIENQISCREKQFLSAALGRDYQDCDPDFSGRASIGKCSGSVVRLNNHAPDEKALVMTSSSCGNEQEIFIASKEQTILSQPFKARLIYSGKSRWDIAIYELKFSYNELEEKFGIDRFTLPYLYQYPNGDYDSFKHPFNDLLSVHSIKGITPANCRLNDKLVTIEVDGTVYQNVYSLSGEHCHFMAPGEGITSRKYDHQLIGITLSKGSRELQTDGTLKSFSDRVYAKPLFELSKCVNDHHAFEMLLPDCPLR